jgi:hypothetical protein
LFRIWRKILPSARHSPDSTVALAKNPVVNNVLYIGSRSSLYAIEASDE